MRSKQQYKPGTRPYPFLMHSKLGDKLELVFEPGMAVPYNRCGAAVRIAYNGRLTCATTETSEEVPVTWLIAGGPL